MSRSGLPARVALASADDTHEFGMRLGRLLMAGDLVVLTGGFGRRQDDADAGDRVRAGGPWAGHLADVRHRAGPPVAGGWPALLHVDAYRLGGAVELDDLDLDADVADSVTVVEWGHGVAERLADAYLEVVLTAGADEARTRHPDRGRRPLVGVVAP